MTKRKKEVRSSVTLPGNQEVLLILKRHQELNCNNRNLESVTQTSGRCGSRTQSWRNLEARTSTLVDARAASTNNLDENTIVHTMQRAG